MSSVLACRAPTVSIVHGEGGSGGALAGAVTDAVAVGELGWFAALAPEGAAAALRQPLERMAGMMRVTPAELLASGFADACVTTGAEREWAAATLDRLRAVAPAQRLARRRARWAAPLTGPGRSDSS
jgi:acetyl-CoA carboxylase alpha subunit